MKEYIKYIYLLLFVSLFAAEVHAQVIHITGDVSKTVRTLEGKGKGKEALSVPVYVFDNKKDARTQANLFRTKGSELGSMVLFFVGVFKLTFAMLLRLIMMVILKRMCLQQAHYW